MRNLLGFSKRIILSKNMSCCPPKSIPFAASAGLDCGHEVNVNENLSYFSVGSSNSHNAVVIFPDVWGWNGGRVRNVASEIATKLSCLVVVPKILQPAFEGGYFGDGLPSTFDMANRRDEFMSYITTISYSDSSHHMSIQQRIQSLFEHLQNSHNTKKIALIGFCWGGWVLAHLASETRYTSQENPFLRCGVICHPSLVLEESAFKKSVSNLVDTIKIPCLWMPAGNDSKEYSFPEALSDTTKLSSELITNFEGIVSGGSEYASTSAMGEWYRILKKNNPKSGSIAFPDMVHGWVPRGDLSNPDVLRGYDTAMRFLVEYIATHMEK